MPDVIVPVAVRFVKLSIAASRVASVVLSIASTFCNVNVPLLSEKGTEDPTVKPVFPVSIFACNIPILPLK